MNRKTHTIDATNQSLGRLASQVAVLLRGKDEASFERHLDNGGVVNVVNASKLKLTGTKMTEKVYTRYSGYPGGLKKRSPVQEIAKKGYASILQKAVYGMLPKNKTRAKTILRLKITE
jgi:large subunit ribosomal protein L13